MIVAIFKGRNGLCGFVSGKTYRLSTKLSKYNSQQVIAIEDITDVSKTCIYSSLETFLENWHVITSMR